MKKDIKFQIEKQEIIEQIQNAKTKDKVIEILSLQVKKKYPVNTPAEFSHFETTKNVTIQMIQHARVRTTMDSVLKKQLAWWEAQKL